MMSSVAISRMSSSWAWARVIGHNSGGNNLNGVRSSSTNPKFKKRTSLVAFKIISFWNLVRMVWEEFDMRDGGMVVIAGVKFGDY